jgi:hypothetical protein
MSIDEIAFALREAPSPTLDAYVNAVGNRKLFVSILVEKAHQSKDLWTVNRIAKALKEITGVDFYPWDLKPLDSWWASNSTRYTNWPYAEYDRGMQFFSSCTYQAALTNFQQVLAIDPTADKSRALAIACAIEVNNADELKRLNVPFQKPNGPSGRWARGITMLSTNAIEQGTKELSSLAKSNPSSSTSLWLAYGNHIVRNVDWQLFNKLLIPSNNVVSGSLTNVAR